MIQPAPPPIALLRRLPSFSGVMLLSALLVSLPWLPLESRSLREREVRTVEQRLAGLPSSQLRQGPAMWHFTVHLVATDEAHQAVSAVYPDLHTDIVMVLQPQQDQAFRSFLRDLNDYRVQRGLPGVQVADQRAQTTPLLP